MSEDNGRASRDQGDGTVQLAKPKTKIFPQSAKRQQKKAGRRFLQRLSEEGDTSQILRRIRALKGVTLRDLARASKISVSYLSNYENGKANITIGSLKKIAQALGVSTSDLLSEEQGRDIVIVPKERRYIRELFESETGTAYQEYMMRSNSAIMHVSIATLPPNSDTGEPSSHYGEEFVYVFKGSLTVILNNSAYRIEEGTMAYYNSSLLHKLANDGETNTEYLHVNTPPTY